MSQPITDAFLSGQGIPVELGEIESELIRLWGPAAERVGGPELENPHVTRLVLANLVVEAGGDGDALEKTLDAVVARYPCRAIVLRRDQDPNRNVRAEVAALCHLPAPGQPQVCSERIVLRAGPNALDLLPGGVRPLLEVDLPFVLWWTSDPRQAEPLFRDLGSECTRLILDLPDPDTEPEAIRLGLDPSISPFSRDSAWFEISTWRELVAQFFDAPGQAEGLQRLSKVEIRVGSPKSSRTPRLAVWLAAWLAGQLGWKAVSRETLADGSLHARFQSKSREVLIEIQNQPLESKSSAMIRGVTLTLDHADGVETFKLDRPVANAPHIRVEICSAHICALPQTIAAPQFDAPRRLAIGLESSRNDLPFQHARPHALWLLGD